MRRAQSFLFTVSLDAITNQYSYTIPIGMELAELEIHLVGNDANNPITARGTLSQSSTTNVDLPPPTPGANEQNGLYSDTAYLAGPAPENGPSCYAWRNLRGSGVRSITLQLVTNNTSGFATLNGVMEAYE